MTVRWAISGVGTAGQARARAILRDPDSVLVATWRGAEVGVPRAGTLAEAIAPADAVAICAPTAVHPAQVRAVLEAGRHVVCEFPLAPDAGAAARLFDLARSRDRVLHVAHIEVLSGVAATLRGNVRALAVRRVELRFERPGPATVPGHELALANVARLHRLVDVAGPVASVDQVVQEPGLLSGRMTLRHGAPVAFAFRQAPDFGRLTTLEVEDHATTWRQENRALYRDGVPQTILEATPLFELDHHHAMRRIAGGAASYVPEERILHVLRLVSALRSGAVGAVP